MPTLNYYLNALGRCSAFYRTDALEGTGIRPHDMPYLFHVCRHPGTTQDCIAKALYVHKTKITRSVTYLEEQGFLMRSPSPEDKRALQVYPTQKALELLPRLREINATWHTVLTKGFSDEETAQFEALLIRALRNARSAVDGESADCGQRGAEK